MIRRKEVWIWTDGQTSLLAEIKKRLISANVLAYWRPDVDTRLTTGASPIELGSILEQRQPEDGEFRPLAYILSGRKGRLRHRLGL